MKTCFAKGLSVALVLIFAVVVQAQNVAVDCSKGKTIAGGLTTLVKQGFQNGPATIQVSGSCNENVVINGFQNLTLTTSTGASINDPSSGLNDVVDILGSRNVTLQGFAVNGGFEGVTCQLFSVCNLKNLTIQGAADAGAIFVRSSGLVTDATTIQNNNSSGMRVLHGSTVFVGPFDTASGVTFQNNGGEGIEVLHGSNVTLQTTAILGHANGDGVSVGFGSVLRLFHSSITGNGGDGLSVNSSVVRFQGGFGPTSLTGNAGNGVTLLNTSTLQTDGPGNPATIITGNSGNGILVSHLSFLRIRGRRNISGNAAPDVYCAASTAKTEGTGGSATPNLGGGTTNCTEPAP